MQYALRPPRLTAVSTSPSPRGTRATSAGARILAYLRFASAHGAHYRVMFSPELRGASAAPAYDRVSRQGFDALIAAVRAVRPDLDRTAARALALTVWSAAHGTAMLAIDGVVPALLGARASASVFKHTAQHLSRMVQSAR